MGLRESIAPETLDSEITSHFESSSPYVTIDSLDFDATSGSSALCSDTMFLHLNGKSYVEIDNDGLFISLPYSTYKNGNTTFVRRGLQIPITDDIEIRCAQPVSVIIVLPLVKMESTINKFGQLSLGNYFYNVSLLS
jgi:hypothetical protein